MPQGFHPGRRVLYLSIESTTGTFAGATTVFAIGNATLPAQSLKFAPTVDFTERRTDSNSAQKNRSVPGAQKATITFSSRWITGASKGVPGALSPLLKTAMKETVVATTSTAYTWDENTQTRLSVGWGTIRDDGTIEVQHAIAGAGLQKLVLKADDKGKPVMADWTLIGKVAYESAVVVALDDSTPQAGSIVYVDDYTKGFTFAGLTVRSGLLSRSISKFELDISQKSDLGPDVGDPSGYDWMHAGLCDVTLKADAAKTTVAGAPDLANLIAGATASAAMTITNAAGNTFVLTLPNLQPTKLSEGSRDGGNVSTWDIEADAVKTNNGSAAVASDAFTLLFGGA